MSASAPTPRPRASAAFIGINTLLLWAATAIAAVALWPIYQDARFVVLVAVTTVLGTIVAILGAVFRWKSFVVILVGFAVLLLAGVPLAVPDQAIAGFLPSLDGIRELLAAVALGWKQLLTITLPVGDYQALLVPAFVLVLTSTIVSLSVALRARWGELGVLPPPKALVERLRPVDIRDGDDDDLQLHVDGSAFCRLGCGIAAGLSRAHLELLGLGALSAFSCASSWSRLVSAAERASSIRPSNCSRVCA